MPASRRHLLRSSEFMPSYWCHEAQRRMIAVQYRVVLKIPMSANGMVRPRSCRAAPDTILLLRTNLEPYARAQERDEQRTWRRVPERNSAARLSLFRPGSRARCEDLAPMPSGPSSGSSTRKWNPRSRCARSRLAVIDARWVFQLAHRTVEIDGICPRIRRSLNDRLSLFIEVSVLPILLVGQRGV
jgi:hypothetical protein